jgi:hypothetical protein
MNESLDQVSLRLRNEHDNSCQSLAFSPEPGELETESDD